MKKLLLCTTFAGALLCAQAQTPATSSSTAAAPAENSALPAIQALFKQYQAIFKSTSGNPLPQLDAMAARPYPPELAALATTVFGDPDALHLRRLPDMNGKRHYALGAPAHTFSADKDNFTASWTDLEANMLADKNGRRIESKVNLDQFEVNGKEAHMLFKGIRGAGVHRRTPGGMWLGKVEGHLASMQAGPKDQFLMRMDDVSVLGDVSMRAKNANIKYDFLIKTLTAGPVVIDDLHMGMRLTQLDVKALENFQHELEKLDAGSDAALKLEAMKTQLRALGKVLAARGSAIEIDDVSASFKGHKASVKGRVSFDGARPADFDNPAALAKKVFAHLEVRVPVALVKEITLNIARGQTPRNPDGSSNEALIATTAQSITDVVMGKMLGQGYARIENEVLVSTIQFRHGKLTINGKEVQLPTLPTPPAAQPVAATSTPRIIPEHCPRAPLPAEAQRIGQTLFAITSFTVGADGHVRDARITQSSNWPDYDQAVIKATLECQWVPAVVNGKAIDTSMTETYTTSPAATPAPAPSAPPGK